jgi:predicted nucleotidyltransferase
VVKVMNKRTVSAEERKNVITALSELLSKDDKIIFAYLHGSFVTDEHFNDLDIAIYCKEMPAFEMLEYELKLEEKLERQLKIPVDLKSLNNAPVSFCYMVLKKGIKIVVNDDKHRVDFEMRTYSNYFDFQPYRRRYLQEVINANL